MTRPRRGPEGGWDPIIPDLSLLRRTGLLREGPRVELCMNRTYAKGWSRLALRGREAHPLGLPTAQKETQTQVCLLIKSNSTSKKVLCQSPKKVRGAWGEAWEGPGLLVRGLEPQEPFLHRRC